MAHAIPPPVNASEQDNDDNANDNGKKRSQISKVTCEFVEMGFPSREGGDVPTLVHSSGGAPKDRNGDGGVAFAINPATADDRRSNRLITFARTGYVCPRCKSRCSDLPSDCAVCGLRLILAPHLARTFHHLFPVRPFEELDEAEVISSKSITKKDNGGTTEMEVENGSSSTNGKKGLEALPILSSSVFTPPSSISSSNIANFVVSSSSSASDVNDLQQTTQKMINIGPSIIANSADCDRCCFGCLKVIGCRPVKEATNKKSNESTSGNDNTEEGEAILRFQCPECHNVFCPDCDAFLHETLHNCPGCLCN